MKTAIHNVAPSTSAERVAAFTAQIDRLAGLIRNAAPAKPEPISNKYTPPRGNDDVGNIMPPRKPSLVTNSAKPKPPLALAALYIAPEGE